MISFLFQQLITNDSSFQDLCIDEITTGQGALNIVDAMGYDSNNEFYKLTDEILHVSQCVFVVHTP